MEAETIIAILNSFAGPAGAACVMVFVFFTVGFSIFKLTDRHLIPFLKDHTSEIKKGFKDITTEMKEDREYHRSVIANMMDRQDKMDVIVDAVKADVDDIKDNVQKIETLLDREKEYKRMKIEAAKINLKNNST